VTVRTTRLEWRTRAGLRLVGDGFGEPAAPVVVLLHGGGQTRHAWGGTGRALARAGFYAIAVDLRGHGESDWDTDGHYGLVDYADDLRTILAEFPRGPTRPAAVGASLGGLTALITEGEATDSLLSAVVLVDIAPRMELNGVMRILSFMKAYPDGFTDLEAAADAIATYLPHRPRPKDMKGLAKNLRLGPDGRYRWHWDPRFVDRKNRRPDPGMQLARLNQAARGLNVPTLLVRGQQSDVLSEESAREFLALVPHAEFVDVASAAHMIAGDKNDVFADAVVEFLLRRAAPVKEPTS
jgi:non-heme chloroperoxidase